MRHEAATDKKNDTKVPQSLKNSYILDELCHT